MSLDLKALAPQGYYIVALSGGADSVCLLLKMKSEGYRIEAAHCNFRLRGAESDRDEAFCVDLCRREGIALHLAHFDTRAFARLHGVSIEMAARQLRYSYFEQLRCDLGADGVCVAHHVEDQVETVLLNLVRGTGLRGLTGMEERNGTIFRPMLRATRKEIESYLSGMGQDYVVDSSNLVDDVKRNRIRLDVLPQLEQMNPSLMSDISRMTRHLSDAQRIIDYDVETWLRHNSGVVRTDNRGTYVEADILVDELLDFPSPGYLLFEMLRRFGFNGVQAEQIFAQIRHGQGRLWTSATHELTLDRGHLLVRPKEAPLRPLLIPETGTYVHQSLRLRVERIERDEAFELDKSAHVAMLDARLVAFPLTFRPVGSGDRFVPFGMKGSKLVSDYLTDRKRNLFQKRAQCVVTDSSGRILWLVGERTDGRFAIGDTTTEVLKISMG